MNILIDILHPGQVHFFKEPIRIWKEQGHNVYVVTRDIKMCRDLLDFYQIDYFFVKKAKNLFGLVFELLRRNLKLFRLVIKLKINVLVGIGGISISLVGFLSRKPRVIFTDSEFARIVNFISFPLATVVYTPSFYIDDIGKKHVRYSSLHEFAYLNPKKFKPNDEILDELNLKPNNYFIIRLCDWQASHDLNQTGFSDIMKREIIEELEKNGRVLISPEGSLPQEYEKYRLKIRPEQMHSLLAFSKLLVTETQTMTSEAAILGVPVIRYNTLDKNERMKSGNMIYLEKTGLVYNFVDEGKAFSKIKEISSKDFDQEFWKEKRDQITKELIDPIPLIVDSINLPHSKKGKKKTNKKESK